MIRETGLVAIQSVTFHVTCGPLRKPSQMPAATARYCAAGPGGMPENVSNDKKAQNKLRMLKLLHNVPD
ncbi:hypothetical protein [Thalassobius sp. I31.1]|uniref:hypothetical protein n=1 Tax=Thalassobius sp. I31.1 TaxID=2109912 RepID=UPI001300742C|nr:hypothetical protein [Thalassobius sp. I31.1]